MPVTSRGLIVLLRSTISLLIFCLLDLSVADRGVMITQTIMVDYSISFRQSYQFCFFLILFIYLFIWVFFAEHGLSLVAASGGCSSLRCAGFSLWLLLLWSMGSRCTGFSSFGAQAR